MLPDMLISDTSVLFQLLSLGNACRNGYVPVSKGRRVFPYLPTYFTSLAAELTFCLPNFCVFCITLFNPTQYCFLLFSC